jgi:glucose-1-phosphatase
MTIRAVLWDIGGVLLRTADWGPRTRLAEHLGMSLRELETLLWGGEMGRKAQLGEVSHEQIWQYVLARLGLPGEQWEALREEFFSGDVFDADLVDQIRRLRPRYRTGIISNATTDMRPFIERELRLVDAFDHVTISAEVGWMKPDHRIYQHALQAMEVAPDSAVFVDDFIENVVAARAIGMQAIHFRDRDQALKDLYTLLDEHPLEGA